MFLGENSDGWQSSPLDKVNASNVRQLGFAWYADTPPWTVS
jgi:glucose dehydrogenase